MRDVGNIFIKQIIRKSEGKIIDGTSDRRKKAVTESSASAFLTYIKSPPLDEPEQSLQGHAGDLQEWGFPKNVAVELESS